MARARRRYWLFKSEPGAFSFDDLLASPRRTTSWDGVRNYQVRNMLRDDVAEGDGVLFYHSNAKPAAVVGLAEVVRAGYPDPTQFEAGHPHEDPGADPDEPRWYCVDVRAVEALPAEVDLAAIKADPALGEMLVARRGSRLSITPVTPAEWARVCALGGLKGRR